MFRRWIIRGSSIQTKFLWATLLLVIVPLGLFGLISLQMSKKSVQEQVSQSNLKLLGQIAEKTNMVVEDVISVSNTFYLDPEVIHGFTVNFAPGSYEEAMLRSTFEELLLNSVYSFSNLKYDVTLLGLNGLQLSTDAELGKANLTKLQNELWYREAAEVNGQISWITGAIPGLVSEQAADSPFYAVRVSRRFETGAPKGIVVIGVNEESMTNLYAGSLDDHQTIIILDQYGNTISAQEESGLKNANLQNRSYYGKISEYDSGYFVDEEMGDEQLISFQTIDQTGWKLVSYMPLRSVLADIRKAQAITVVVLLTTIMLAVIASYVIARRLAIPIKRLTHSFGRLETGDMSVRAVPGGNDEIGLLAGRFNDMVVRLDSLMDDIKSEQHLKRHAELQALQSQINPHFLYNTLASIRFMLYKRDKETVDEVIVALVKLLKHSLSKQDELLPVEEELNILRHYAFIQQIKYGDRLKIEYELDEDIFPYSILRFVLQPLVENAIFHGLEPKKGEGTVRVKGYTEMDALVFEVADDGVGIPAGKLERLLSEEEGAKAVAHNGGVRNVHGRIRLYFGDDYGLFVQSKEGVGTKVTMRVPAIYKWDEVSER